MAHDDSAYFEAELTGQAARQRYTAMRESDAVTAHEWYEEFVFTITSIERDNNYDEAASITFEETGTGEEVTLFCATPQQARINAQFTLRPVKDGEY